MKKVLSLAVVLMLLVSPMKSVFAGQDSQDPQKQSWSEFAGQKWKNAKDKCYAFGNYAKSWNWKAIGFGAGATLVFVIAVSKIAHMEDKEVVNA